MRIAIVILTFLCIALSTNAQIPNGPWNISKCLQSKTPFIEMHNTSNNIKCHSIITDRDGYVWIGSSSGIYRFDGIHFQYFEISEKRDDDNRITELFEDTVLNCIWATKQEFYNLIRIDKKKYTIKIIPYNYNDNNNNIHKATTLIRTFHNYNDSLLLGSTFSGLYLINKNTGSIQGPYSDTKKKTTNCTNKFIDTGDKVYFTNNNSLSYIEKSNIYEPIIKTIQTDIPGKIKLIDMYSDSTLFIYTDNTNTSELWSYNRYTGKENHITSLHKKVNSIQCMHDGIWLTTNNGLDFYDLRNNELRTYTTRNSSLMSNKTDAICRSKQQSIVWIGTTEGIAKIDYLSSKFSITDLRRFSNSSSCDPFSLFKDHKKNYWIWCLDGLYLKQHNEETFKQLDIDMETNKRQAITRITEDCTTNSIYLIKTRSISRVDLSTLKTEIVLPNTAKINTKTSKMGPNNTLYTCDHKQYITTRNGKYTIHTYKPEIDINPTDITFGEDYTMWISDNEGNIYKVDLQTDSISREVTIRQGNCRINNIRYAKRGGLAEIWIGTNKNGLYYYIPEYKRTNKIEYSPILINNTIHCLEVDINNNVWAATNDGLVCINNHNGQTYEYKSSTHNICPSFNSLVSSTSADGHILMGGTNYFIEFDADNFSDNNYFPTPIVSSYRFTNSTTYSYDDLTSREILDTGDTINIPKGIRSIQLFVRVLNHNKSRNNTILWRLPDSEKKEWHISPTTAPIIFGNLKHGVHPLELRSCDGNGSPTKNSRIIYINKEVYFYEHPAFAVLLTLIIISLIILFIYLKIRINIHHRIHLEEEVNRQAGEIRLTNIALTNHKNIIVQQNKELLEQKKNLEKEVANRTADLKEACARAEENSQLKSAFLANLSHEVRTPMNCIMGFSKLIAENLCTPEETKEYAHLIRESGNSLLVLINDLLDISRIESGQLRVNRADFAIYQEIAETYNLLQMERKNEDVKFLLSNDDLLKNRTICSDKDRFRQIIINIVYNAFKFTQSGYVKINATIATPKQLIDLYEYPKGIPLPEYNELLFLSIEDTGVGIPNDKLEAIFEPFRKLNAGKKSIYPGLGLGLNIVKNLVTHMGGQIWVTSEEGQGTTFYFYLPFDYEK